MSPLITYLVVLAMSGYVLLIVIELVVSRAVRRFLIQATAVLLVGLVLHYVSGFPAPRVSFGGGAVLGAVALMFICVVLGMIARYFFYLKGRVSWRSLLKPLCVSPIVLLPLLGSIQGLTDVQAIHLVSFGFLAFQNGFFWEVVFESSRSKL